MSERKHSKISVRYTDDHGDGNSKEWCAKCVQFEKPQACRIVFGRIDPQGWCMLYEKKS